MTSNDMIKLIEPEYKKATAGAFDSIEDAIAVACSALKYLEEQCSNSIPDLRTKNEHKSS